MRTFSESVQRQPVEAIAATGAGARTLAAADVHQVMREQLDFLIGHVESEGYCACPSCVRYKNIRVSLLEAFRG